MKGNISETLLKVLADHQSRADLREALISGKSGSVNFSNAKSIKVVVGADVQRRKAEAAGS